MANKQFQTVWVMEPGKDFSTVLNHGQQMKFICNGFERGEDRLENIQAAVEEFNPETDAWVPVGRMTSVAQTGLLLARAYPNAKIQLGVYKDGDYTWQIA